MMDLKSHSKVALAYFLLAAIFGVVLRSFYSFDIPVTYKFIVHAHSHIALLGWVYLALTTILYKMYLQEQDLDNKYRYIFWFTQLTLVGMLLTFPFQGYALFSIIFSTLFLFASYWFTWFFFKNVPRDAKTSQSYKCIKIALWYLVVSSLGPWALGGIMNTLGGDTVWYRLAIYFYLHFLYNGWMIMALIGMLFCVLERHRIIMPNTIFKNFFRLINLGIILSFLLSTIFTNPPIVYNILGGLGALSQLSALVILLWLVIKDKEKITMLFSVSQKGLLKLIGILLAVKMLFQLLTALPYFARLAWTYLDFTIGYLHWTFLGVVSLSLFLFLDYFRFFKISKWFYTVYLVGFIITEVLIFYKGLVAWQSLSLFAGYFEVLAIGSLLIPLSLILILFSKKG
jgi:hypothetical protein